MTYNVDKNGKDKDANVEEHCITCTKTPAPPTNFVNKRKGRKPMSENAEDDDEW